MRRVHIQVVQHLRPGGIETMALDLLRCSDKDTEVHIISLEGRKNEVCSDWPRLKPYRNYLHFLNKQPGIQLGIIFKLRSLLRSLGANAVQTHHVGPLLYGGISARLAGICRVVHTEHDAWHLQDRKRRKLQRFLINIIQPILVVDSILVGDELQKYLPNQNYSVISNGVDCELFSPGDLNDARKKLNLPTDVPMIGNAGRMETVKGQDQLLRAHALMADTVHLAIAGTGSLENDLKQLARSLGTQERVHFLGCIDDMPTFYQSLNVFCLPSKMEGMPLSPLEAQASGIICVGTDVGGMREALCPKTGTIVTDSSPNGLAIALKNALLSKPNIKPQAYPRARANLINVVSKYQTLMCQENV